MKSVKFTYTTLFSDLDTQKHVNSNKYFDLFESGKYLLLAKQGITKEFLLKNDYKLIPVQTNFKFAKQIVENETIEVRITLSIMLNGYLKWNCEIENNKSICFKISSINWVKRELLDFIDLRREIQPFNLKPLDFRDILCNTFSSSFDLRNIERNYFGGIAENITWKLFEETRWQHSNLLNIDLDFLRGLDIAFFWREGEYQYLNPINPVDSLKIKIWFEKITEVKLVYALEMVNQENQVICKSISDFISVSQSKRKIKRIPKELIDCVQNYIKN